MSQRTKIKGSRGRNHTAGSSAESKGTLAPAVRLRARSARGAAVREHARRHIDRLYEVSRLFANVSNVSGIEATIADVFELVTQALPLRSVVLIEEAEGHPRTMAWHAVGADADMRSLAEASARESYDYLIPEGRGRAPDAGVIRRTGAFLAAPPKGGVRGPKDFLLLPLVTDHLPIAGALQIEMASRMDPIDLAFINGVAIQLAVALDRHQAWRTEVALRARAEALAIQNAHLYEDALRAVNARDDFIGVASHELLSPITALDLQAKMLLSRRHGPARSPEQLESAYALIHRQTARLVMLINRMLDVTRAAAGQLSIEAEEGVDLAEVAHDAAERLVLEAAQAGSTITVDASESVMGCWDPFRLEQVATNLLTNAIKYGGRKPIEVRVERRGASARVSVRDQGLGITIEDQDRIFERFARSGEVQRHPGLGLGLYITRQIVEQHGGKIGVESVLGAGSVFTVDLPLEPPEAGRATA